MTKPRSVKPNKLEKKDLPAKPKHTKRYVFGGLAVLAGLLFLGVRAFMSAPAEGEVNNSAPPPAVQAAQTETLQYTDDWLRFSYPSDYQKIQNDSRSAGVADQFILRTKSSEAGTRQIAVMVKQGGSLQEDSAYKLRSLSPAYARELSDLNGRQVIVFKKSDKTEVTYFVSGPGAYAVFAGTSTRGGERLSEEIAGVIQTLSWAH